jgi:hypothetical protein
MIKLYIINLSTIAKFGVFHTDGSIFFIKPFNGHMAFADLFNERGIEAFCEDNATNHKKEFRTVQYLRTDMLSV